MSSPGACASIRTELGVYVLGAIEPGDRARVDRHLMACPWCREELAGLAGLPGLLRSMPAQWATLAWTDQVSEPPGPPLDGLISQVTRTRGRRRRLAAAAAAALLAGVATVASLQAFGPQPVTGTAPHWAVVTGASPATKAWAAVRYAAQPWGTELEVQVAGIPAGTRCRLLVAGPGGQDVAAGGWTIASGSRQAWYPASVPFGPASLRGFDVTAAGKTLVDIPAP